MVKAKSKSYSMNVKDNTGKFINVLDQVSREKTPYMLFDIDSFVASCAKFKKLLPSVRLLYAVKALYTHASVDAARQLVDGFDVASPKEAEDIVRSGVDVANIEVSNPVKSEDSIGNFISMGITKFTVQSKDEVDKIYSLSNGVENIDILVRIRVNDGYSLVPLSDKFGCDPFYAPDILQYAASKGMNARGVSFHVGSQLIDVNSWFSAIKLANELIATARNGGLDSDTVNIGGGFCAQYFDTDPDLESVAKIINKALDPSINYLAEPGRYLVASSAAIVSSVISVEDRKEESWIFMDTGRFQAFLGADRYEIFPYVPIVLSGDTGEVKDGERTVHSVLTGPTCDSQDIVSSEIMLPAGIRRGDMLIFPNSGAYTVVYGSNFNGFTPPRVVHIKNGKVEKG